MRHGTTYTDPVWLDIADTLIAAREARGLTRRNAAARSGLSRSTIERIENSTGAPHVDSVIDYATFLGYTLTLTRNPR